MRRSSLAGVAGFALTFGLLTATPVAAASATGGPQQLWVNGSVAVSGNHLSCATPGFETISSALAVAHANAVINICAGTYDEQLVITGAVTLQASDPGSVTVMGPSDPSDTATPCDADGPNNQDVVDICGAPIVTIKNLAIQGGFPDFYCNDDFYGIAVLGGSTLRMSGSTVEDVSGPDVSGCQGGIGIQVGLATSATSADPGHATLTNDLIETYNKGGITVDGTGSSAVMTGVTVTGAGPAAIGANGIQISDGARATITGGSITGNECNIAPPTCGSDPDQDAQSTGILLYDAGKTTVSGVSITGNDIGIYNVGDVLDGFYTPPSPFNISESFSGMTLSNRYENVGIDSGMTVLKNSTITGGNTGVSVFQYAGQRIAAKLTAFGDTITGAAVAAVNIDSDGQSGDLKVAASITKSSFDTTDGAGILNVSSDPGSTSVVGAINDWWGTASGPSLWSFGTGASVSQNVNFFPWATNAGMTTLEVCLHSANAATVANDKVLCAASTSNALLANAGSGDVLIIGNNANDTLTGSGAGGATWIIAGSGTNTINGEGPPGTGFIQLRGNTGDAVTNTVGYTIAG